LNRAIRIGVVALMPVAGAGRPALRGAPMKFIAAGDGILFDLLQARFPEASRTTIRQMLRHGRVRLAGRMVSLGKTQVRAGQVIEVAAGRRAAGPTAAGAPGKADAPGHAGARVAVRPPGRILLRDEHLIAVEKPAGILSVARDLAADDTFYRRLNAYVQATSGGRARIFIVHRLDREASGVMLFAFSQDIQERLQRTWATVEKHYWALVEGRAPEGAGTIRSWLRENRVHRVYSVPEGRGAKLAVTHYRVQRVYRAHSLLDVRIDTGRKNQIRVHLSELGCPIVGDRKYGARTNPIRRLGLHAYALAFTHPVSGEWIRLRLPLPSAFRIR
jgi:23S rRNA pseudouridine1911/1915/1917 synthase